MRSEVEWFDLIRSKPEDLSVSDYCNEAHIAVSTYYKYSRRMKKQESFSLIPVVIKDMECFEFECNGYAFKVDDRISSIQLQHLLKATQ